MGSWIVVRAVRLFRDGNVIKSNQGNIARNIETVIRDCCHHPQATISLATKCRHLLTFI